VATALVAVGCGGSNGGGHTTPTTGSTPGTSITVNIGSTNSSGQSIGVAEFLYLTGQGRAFGDLSAVIQHITLEDEVGEVSVALGRKVTLPLTQFTSQALDVDVPFTGQNARLFQSYSLNFLDFLQEGATPTQTPTVLNPPPPLTFSARVRVFPGRITSTPIFIDDSMFSTTGVITGGDDTITFNPPGVPANQTNFALRNLNALGQLPSFISDYVKFDVSHMPVGQLPQLSDGETAGKIFASGDNFAVANAATSGRFEVLTTVSSEPLVGNFGAQTGNTPGTYDLKSNNPVLGAITPIVSIQGIWRDYATVMSGFQTFDMISFPSILDNSSQEFVMIVRAADNTISNMYFGLMDYSAGKFQAFPIKDIVTATVSGELDGTISGYMTGSGAPTNSPDSVRSGSFAFTTGSRPAGFPASGTFAVFRK